MFRGFRYRLDLMLQQGAMFQRFVGVCRLVCNIVLKQRSDRWSAYKGTTGKAIRHATAVGERPRNAAQDLTEQRADSDAIGTATKTCEQQALGDLDRELDNVFHERSLLPHVPRAKAVDAAGLMNAGEQGFAAADVGTAGQAAGDAGNVGRATADTARVAQGTEGVARGAMDAAKGVEEGRAKTTRGAGAVAGKAEGVVDGARGVETTGSCLQGRGLEGAGGGSLGGAGGGSKVPVPQPPWPVTDLRIQNTLKQSLEETCGQACAAHLAQALGFKSVTEDAIIALIGEAATRAEELAQSLRKLTGKVVAGGATQASIPLSDVSKLVNGLTSRGTRPFSVLLYGPNPSLRNGHWVVVEGMKRGKVKILDPGGVEYRVAESDFFEAWAYQRLFFFR